MSGWYSKIEQIVENMESMFEAANQQFPLVEIWTLRLIDFLFSPREIIKQMIIVNVLQLILMSADAASKFTNMVLFFVDIFII